jgi:hypothetical protein
VQVWRWSCSLWSYILTRTSTRCINGALNNRVRWCREFPTASPLAKLGIVNILFNSFVQGLCLLPLAWHIEKSTWMLLFIPRMAEWNVDLHVRVRIIVVLWFNKFIFSLTSVKLLNWIILHCSVTLLPNVRLGRETHARIGVEKNNYS